MQLDSQERLLSFQFAKVTCSSEISAQTGLCSFCHLKTLPEILELDFSMLVSALNLNEDQERQFVLYLELEALKAAIAQYLCIEHPAYDAERCRITSIEHSGDSIDIALIILPPKELPKITSCSSVKTKPEALS